MKIILEKLENSEINLEQKKGKQKIIQTQINFQAKKSEVHARGKFFEKNREKWKISISL